MSEAPAEPVKRPAEPVKRQPERRRVVVIRSFPKVVFLYPTLLAALLACVWTWASMRSGVGLDQVSLTPGRIFWWVFAINLGALAFDFTRGAFVALVACFVAVSLSIFLLDERLGFVAPIRAAFATIQLRAHPHFYAMLAAALAVLLGLVVVHGRFDYWEITHNELLHHHGFLGDVERFPAPNLRMTKEITDLFEYCLLLSGRLVLHPQQAARAIVLDNVLGVNRVERRIQEMLAMLAVKVEQGPPAGEEG